MEQSTLIQRLETIRGMVRRRLLGYGFCVVLAGGVFSFISILGFDWLLALPAVLRILVAILFLVGFVGASLHWIARPMQMKLGLDEIAAKLEQHFGCFQDRLASTVNFIERRAAQEAEGDSVGMMERTIANADRLARKVRLASALSLRPLFARGALVVLSLALLTTILVASPGWVQTGFYRYVYPFGEIEWPRRVSIVLLTGMERVALGESVTVRMRIDRGLSSGLRGVLHMRNGEGEMTSLAMQRDADGLFYATVDALTEDLDYWFEAGDASTEKRPGRIRVVRRPAVVEALATVAPPPYATNRSSSTYDLNEGPVSAVTGSRVTVNVRASKPIPRGGAGARTPVGVEPGLQALAGLRLERSAKGDDREVLIPLLIDAENPHLLSARFEIVGDMHFRFELRDEEGFANRGAVRHSILATPDRPPVVTALEPRSVTEVTPHGVIPLVVRVEDDFGITRLALHAKRARDDQTFTVLLSDRVADPLESRSRGVGTDAAEGVEATVEFTWSMEPMALSPGDVLVYNALAADNFPGAGRDGQVGRSASLRAVIMSELEFDVRVRDELALLQKRIRRVALDETELLDTTIELLQQGEQPTPLSDEQRARASDASTRQARLIQRVRYLASRFSQLGKRMQANLTADQSAQQRTEHASETLKQVAGGPMTTASGALADSSEQTDPEGQQARLQKTAQEQETTLDRLGALIRTMSQWGNYQWVVSQTRDLVDRQEDLRRQTAALGKTMLGKSVESLEATEAAGLKHEQRRQQQIATDVEDLLARMERLHAAATEKDPSGAEAMDAALRAARSRDVTARLRAAAEAIALNRTAAAVIDQQAVVEGLRKMLRALHERDRRELAELRKRLQRAEDQVALLIEQQSALRLAVHEAGLLHTGPDDTALNSFEQEQHRLRRNTRSVAEELADTERTEYTARTVRMAELPMGEAEEHLREGNAEDALPAQDEALELLEDSLAQLDKLAREAAENALRRSLAQIREDLESVRIAQSGVNAGVTKLRDRVASRDRLRRAETREAAKLARQQAGVRALLDQVLPDLEKVPVYEWALRRVADWMDSCRKRLNARQVDNQLVVTAERIVRELDRLIAAIVETESLPLDTEFAEAGDGGGGGATVGASQPVPTVAELFVLKAMQAEINRRTAGLYQSVDVDVATEEQLRELEFVGEDQAQVRHLTELVTENARHP